MSPQPRLIAAKAKSVEWYTPRWIVREMEHRFGQFQLDPAACSAEVAVAPKFYTPAEDGLLHPWAPYRVFLNPPYGDGVIGQWMDKAWVESRHGALVVCLVPAYTGSRWWHDLVIGKAEVRYIEGRVVFDSSLHKGRRNGRHDVPFDSALVIYHPPGSSFERRAQSGPVAR